MFVDSGRPVKTALFAEQRAADLFIKRFALTHDVTERFAIEAVRHCVAHRVDVSVPRIASDQRGFAEEIALAEPSDFGERSIKLCRFGLHVGQFFVGQRGPTHGHLTLSDDVESVTDVAVSDDPVTGRVFFPLHVVSDRGQGRHPDARERVAAMQHFAEKGSFTQVGVAGDYPKIHFHDPVGDIQNAIVVSDNDDGCSVFSGLPLKQRDNLASRFFVKRRSRFVGQQDVRAMDQAPGDGDALFLTAR